MNNFDSISEKIRIAGIANDSIVDGPGLRFTIFTQGCPHNCYGCHNPQTHDFEGGYWMTFDEILTKIKSNPILTGVTFSGGEPFMQAKAMYRLGLLIKSETKLNIITYTGFTWESLIASGNEDYMNLLSVTDYLVDGPFISSKKSYSCKYRGSTNQRYIDCQNSLKTGNVITMFE